MPYTPIETKIRPFTNPFQCFVSILLNPVLFVVPEMARTMTLISMSDSRREGSVCYDDKLPVYLDRSMIVNGSDYLGKYGYPFMLYVWYIRACVKVVLVTGTLIPALMYFLFHMLSWLFLVQVVHTLSMHRRFSAYFCPTYNTLSRSREAHLGTSERKIRIRGLGNLDIFKYCLSRRYESIYRTIYGHATTIYSQLGCGHVTVMVDIGACLSVSVVLVSALCTWMLMVQADFRTITNGMDTAPIYMNSSFIYKTSLTDIRREACTYICTECGHNGPMCGSDNFLLICRIPFRHTYLDIHCYPDVLYLWLADACSAALMNVYIYLSAQSYEVICPLSRHELGDQVIYGNVTLLLCLAHWWILLVQVLYRFCLCALDGCSTGYPCNTWGLLMSETLDICNIDGEHVLYITTTCRPAKLCGSDCIFCVRELCRYCGLRFAHPILILCIPGSVRAVRARSLVHFWYLSLWPVSLMYNGNYSHAGLACWGECIHFCRR